MSVPKVCVLVLEVHVFVVVWFWNMARCGVCSKIISMNVAACGSGGVFTAKIAATFDKPVSVFALK
jgi:hypothetical protein